MSSKVSIIDTPQLLTAKPSEEHWCSKHLYSLFDTESEKQPGLAENSQKYIKEKRVLDFYIAPGMVSARVQNADATPFPVTISLNQLTDAEWELVFAKLAGQALFLSKLLAGELPSEIKKIFEELNINFLPSQLGQFNFTCKCQKASEICPHLGAAYLIFCEKVDRNPFYLFSLRGRGRDETIFKLRNIRNELKKNVSFPEERQNEEDSAEATIRKEKIRDFWSANQEIFDIGYSIKADELPAAILRRLDPLPLRGLEEDIDFIIEEAYAQVTRRAQVFGLGFSRRDRG
jgi:uncharacterized Zn finger protein